MFVIRGAYIRGGLYSGGLIFGILRYFIPNVQSEVIIITFYLKNTTNG